MKPKLSALSAEIWAPFLDESGLRILESPHLWGQLQALGLKVEGLECLLIEYV